MSPTISFSPSIFQLMDTTPSDCVMVIMSKVEHKNLLEMQKEVVELREENEKYKKAFLRKVEIKLKLKELLEDL